jgi:SAM-dependent methyltransferase
MQGDTRYAAKFYPYRREEDSYLIERAPSRSEISKLPVPPKELWWGYTDSEDHYLQNGKEYVDKMIRVLEQGGCSLSSCKRILDFGAASGIMIRWLAKNATGGEVWGVDISGAHMIWCQQHLSPPFKFATTTSFPHLPFEDGYFDLIYAGSVFSHIADLAEAWLLELRRIVRPGGLLYLTVQDNRTIELYQNDPNFFAQKHLRERDQQIHYTKKDWDFFTLDRAPGEGGPGHAQVFYQQDYLRRHWANYLKVVSITPESYWYQSAVLLQKT